MAERTYSWQTLNSFTISHFLFPWAPCKQASISGCNWGTLAGATPQVSWRLHYLLRPSSCCPSEWGFSVLNLLCAKDQINEIVGTGQAFSSFSIKLWKGFLNTFPHCFFLPSFSSPLDLCHCLQSIGQVIIFSFLKVVFETVYLWLGLKPMWQELCAMLSHCHVLPGLEPG